MNKILIALSLCLTMVMAACSPSAEEVAQKIKNHDGEMTEKDYSVMFNYLTSMMADSDFSADGFNDKYPEYKTFKNFLTKSEDATVISMWDSFLDEACKNGKDKIYDNPIYSIIINKYSPTTEREAAIVTDYVASALTSGYKGRELASHYPYAEQMMVNWSNSSDPVKVNAINRGLDKAIGAK